MSPVRWEVMCPFESFRGVPSGVRINDKNWYSVLLASTARFLPLRSSRRIVFLIMMGVRLTPKLKPYVLIMCGEAIFFL